MSFLELTTVNNGDFLGAFSRLGSIGFNLLNDIHALDNLSKDNMLAIQPRSLGSAKEKLGSVGVGSGIGHAQDSRSGVLQLEVLVFELVAVDGLASSSVVVGEVSALAHEVGDHAVEGGSLVAHSLFTSAKSTEILGGPGDHIRSQLHDDAAHRAASSSHVKVNTR